MSKHVVIAGAGLGGSLLACYLAKRGYKIDMYERRVDMRKVQIDAGRSINLAMSTRGWTALDGVGLGDEMRDIAIPMEGRMIHNMDGSKAFQPYGQEGQAIYSISRGALNKRMMDAAEEYDEVNIHFNWKCEEYDSRSNEISFKHTETDELKTLKPDLIFGADGAFSMVRYSMQKTPLFNYSQQYLEHGYKEIEMPAAEGGGHRIETNALHIWPRKSFMLIALPNLDGTFTCTLFAPLKGENSFESIKTDDDILNYFNKWFPSAVPHFPTLVNEYHNNPTSTLMTVKCSPWVINNAALLGDAAHAVVPFYGQGMNCAFEDSRVLWDIMEKHGEDWDAILAEYNRVRVPDGQAIADLAIRNFIEMRDLVADPRFLLRKKVEKMLEREFPDKFDSQYGMVTFSNVRYSEALRIGDAQSELLDEIMRLDNIEERWDSNDVKELAHNWFEKHK